MTDKATHECNGDGPAVARDEDCKALVARMLHRESPRSTRPFLRLNYVARAEPGRFELAHTGTMLLDEIGGLPPPRRTKPLQVLQPHRCARLGSRQDIYANVRVVAATNRHLESLVDAGRFRADPYDRLKVGRIHVPPLRDRREEIPLFVDASLARYSERYGRPRRTISAETQHFLEDPWPGNVRQLENPIKRVVALDSAAWVREELVSRPHEVAPAAPPADGTPLRRDSHQQQDHPHQ